MQHPKKQAQRLKTPQKPKPYMPRSCSRVSVRLLRCGPDRCRRFHCFYLHKYLYRLYFSFQEAWYYIRNVTFNIDNFQRSRFPAFFKTERLFSLGMNSLMCKTVWVHGDMHTRSERLRTLTPVESGIRQVLWSCYSCGSYPVNFQASSLTNTKPWAQHPCERWRTSAGISHSPHGKVLRLHRSLPTSRTFTFPLLWILWWLLKADLW